MAKQYSPEEQVKRLTKKLETEKKRGEHFFSMYLQERTRAESFLRRIETLQEIEKHDQEFINHLKETIKLYQEIISHKLQAPTIEPSPDKDSSESNSHDPQTEELEEEFSGSLEVSEECEITEQNHEQLNSEITDLLLSAGLFPCRVDCKDGKNKGGQK